MASVLPSVLALIPARAGSKGVPHKNLRPLGGHSLLAWSIAACRKAATVNRVVVSTDSPHYAAVARDLGAEVPFLRPAEISGDHATDRDFVVHALDWFRALGEEPDLVVHIRPTTPLRDPRMIDAAVRAFMETPEATALRSVHEMAESAYKTFEITADRRLKRVGVDSTALDAANDARQHFPATYQANGYVDVLSTAFIRASGVIHGDRVMPFVTPTTVEVDTEEDFARLELHLSQAPDLTKGLFDTDAVTAVRAPHVITQIRHTGLVVADLERALDFWCGVLGFRVERRMDEAGSHIDAMMGMEQVRLTTVKLAAADGNLIELLHFHSHPDQPAWTGTPSSTGFTHMAFTVDDLDATCQRLREAGVTFCAPPQRSPDGRVRVTYGRGPEGVLLELVETLRS